MVDIEKEGYVSVQNNTIPLRNYLFYLTYNDRATSINNMDGVDLTAPNIYGASTDYYRKRHNESSVVSNSEKGEIVLSFSPRLCYLATKYKFHGKVEFFKRDFTKTVNDIIGDNLEQPEYSMFVHEYDSKQMRVHAHVIFYPYLSQTSSLTKADGTELPLRPHKLWIDPKRLSSIKESFNNYAKKLYKGLEAFDKSFPDSLPLPKVDNKELFKLIKISPNHKPKFEKSSLGEKWPDFDRVKLANRLKDLSETTDDSVINGNNDFSIVVDYLYDFNDPSVYKLFFQHKALKNIVRGFSVFKSNPKFSSVFLKLLSITKDSEVIDMIEDKTKSNKAQELTNIIAEYYTDDPNRVQSLSSDQTKERDHGH